MIGILGAGACGAAPPERRVTVEGVAPARAICAVSSAPGVGKPIIAMVAALAAGEVTVQSVVQTLLSRPLKPE